jgi:tetratricopeptide (TPR) repeat protein
MVAASHCYGRLGVWDTLWAFSTRLVRICDSLKIPETEAHALLNAAIALKSWGRFDEAVKYYEQALDIFSTLKLPVYQALS